MKQYAHAYLSSLRLAGHLQYGSGRERENSLLTALREKRLQRSERRAQAVRDWLAGNGASLRMSARGSYSSTTAVAWPAERQPRARIEIVVKTH